MASLKSDDDLLRACEHPVEVLFSLEGGSEVLHLSDGVVVKIGASRWEAQNQSIARALVDSSILRIPEVYRFIEAKGTGYLFMEYMEGKILESVDEPARMDQVMKILAHLGQIKGTKTGPLGGGPVHGELWSDDLIFTPATPRDIEQYFNRVLSKAANPQEFCISNYEPTLCHLDISLRNLLWLQDGAVALIDWESAGFYPRFFERAAIQVNTQVEPQFSWSLLYRFPPLSIDEENQFNLLLQSWAYIQRFY